MTDNDQSSLSEQGLLRPNSKFSIFPFDENGNYPFNVKDMSYVELKQDSKQYDLVIDYIADNSLKTEDCSQAASFLEPILGKSDDDDSDCDECDLRRSKKADDFSLNAGLGIFAILSIDKQTHMYALHQTIGEPLATNCGVVVPKNLILFTKGVDKGPSIAKFLKELVDLSEKTQSQFYTCFKWNSRYEYWRRSGVCRARNMDSVVLPEATTNKIVQDVDRFLHPSTKAFYDQHGIPYRRSFLFYGVPGAGKTSLIQALAGHYKRNVSFLQLTDKEMTDTSLMNSIAQLNKNTIVVMEDVDSCFSGRTNKIAHSKITFSGLLNALDGVGSSVGQIFILTTNLKEQLDPALIRCGRVDVKVEFHNAVDEQCAKMWKSFYPDASEEYPSKFITTLRKKLDGNEINTASLQHFFVVNMHSTPQEALDSLSSVIDDMDFLNSKIKEEALTLIT